MSFSNTQAACPDADGGPGRERAWLAARLAEWRQLEAMGLVAGGLAHDLNNQITMIGHTVELAAMLDDPARYRESCGQVQELCEQARLTVQRIQAFGRQATGRRQRVELGELTQATIRLLRASVPANVDLRAEIQPVGLPVWANANQVQEGLIHLVGAAVAVMPAGGGKIRVGLSEARGEADGARGARVWRLRVEGAQGEPGLWRELGAGREAEAGELAERVRAVLDAHRAVVRRDEDGAGLRVIWPAEAGEVGGHDGATPGAERSAGGSAPSTTDGMAKAGGAAEAEPGRAHVYAGWRIAVVEDDAAESALLTEVLRSRGARVSAFAAADDFLRWLGAGPAPDVLIVDQVLDEHGGQILAERFGALSPGGSVLMIGASIVEQAMDGGADGRRRVLAKPFGFDQLFAALDAFRARGGGG